MRDRLYKCLGAALTLPLLAAVATRVVAQGPPPLLLVLDEAFLDRAGVPPGARNVEAATVGLRSPIPFFATRVGAAVTLANGQDGRTGMFALGSVPESWATERGAKDGLKNFLLAGPGLGSTDSEGERTPLLEDVENFDVLDAARLAGLAGRTVCAVVYRGRITVVEHSADLTGANLGVVAFQITNGQAGSTTIKVLNTRATCSGALAPLPAQP